MFRFRLRGYNLTMENSVLLRDINPDSLTDIKSIDIDCNLPISDRVKTFLTETKSAYLFAVNGKAVKVVFDRRGKNMEECLINALKNLSHYNI